MSLRKKYQRTFDNELQTWMWYKSRITTSRIKILCVAHWCFEVVSRALKDGYLLWSFNDVFARSYQQLYHIFAYLKSHHNARLVLDPSYPNINIDEFEKRNWKEFYGETKGAKPTNAPRPLGKELLIRCYVDADFAGDLFQDDLGPVLLLSSTWRLSIGFQRNKAQLRLAHLGVNFALWSNVLNIFEGCVTNYGWWGFEWKTLAIYLYGDNHSVLWNTSVPESTLKKKSNSVAYHFLREGISTDEWRTTYLKSSENPSDFLTKSLPSGLNRYRKVRMVLYDMYPEWKYI